MAATTPLTAMAAPTSTPQEVLLEFPAAVAVATSTPNKTETIAGLISRIAKEYRIASTTLYNLAKSESGLQADPPGHNDGGSAAGIVQIHYKTWGFTKEQVLDPEFSLRFAAKYIARGEEWKYWTPCSCVLYSRAQGTTIPGGMNAWDFYPNVSLKNLAIGDLVLFRYKDGTRHVGTYKGMKGEKMVVAQSNFRPCLSEVWYLLPTDPSIYGYWHPAG